MELFIQSGTFPLSFFILDEILIQGNRLYQRVKSITKDIAKKPYVIIFFVLMFLLFLIKKDLLRYSEMEFPDIIDELTSKNIPNKILLVILS